MRNQITTCSIDDCNKPAWYHGWCNAHYLRWRRYGDPLLGSPNYILRYWARVDPCRTDGCYLWLGLTNQRGYGRIKLKGLNLAHHFLAGHPPPGMEWDHLCRTPACVSPEHLELVTHRENVKRHFAWKKLQR